jgi:hypothetical protein
MVFRESPIRPIISIILCIIIYYHTRYTLLHGINAEPDIPAGCRWSSRAARRASCITRHIHTYHTILHPHMVLYPAIQRSWKRAIFGSKRPRFFNTYYLWATFENARFLRCSVFRAQTLVLFLSHNINSLFKIENTKKTLRRTQLYYEPRGCATNRSVWFFRIIYNHYSK